MSFLSGEGEMARRIREFDWATHPFGPPETWPQSLRSALGICLNSAFPTAIYWGPELRLLYNDAWSTIPGPRHPACLGEPAAEVWSDIWHVIEPQFAEVIERGAGLFVDDQMLPMRRYGIEEETYWSYSFTPIRGEDGSITGIFNSGQETTDKVLRQRQTAFLLEAGEAVRELAGSEEIMSAVCRMLGEYLGAVRVGIRERDTSAEQFPVSVEWAAEGWGPAGQAVRWSALGTMREVLEAGRAVRVDRTEALENRKAREIAARLGAASGLALPSFKSASLSAVLFVHKAEPHAWTDEEVATATQVFGLATQTIERERMLAREKAMMHEIDHRARNLLGISQALVRLTRATDVASYKESLLDRLSALGKTLGILSDAKWSGANLQNVLESELAPFMAEGGEDRRVTLRGPKVVLASAMVQPVAMALHELTTNAVKYGALAGEGGALDVGWDTGPGGVLTLVWRERSASVAEAAAPATSGFGTQLLTLAVEDQLDGTITRRVTEGAFECVLRFPLFEEG
ncbi:sensor histidine kinase [Roseovarius indicus]|uniref:sensor histidine kinase n=1 Tax=Roseovarius indicus TaxID=540747 RepID=UPI0032EB4AC2